MADLDAQSTELARRRACLAEVLSRDGDLVASPAMAGLLDRLRGVVADQEVVHREQKLLKMAEATMPEERFAELAAKYDQLLNDPQVIARSTEWAARFERLTVQGPDDPEVLEVAGLIAGYGAAFADAGNGAADGNGTRTVGWELFLGSLTTAQRHAVTAAAETWS